MNKLLAFVVAVYFVKDRNFIIIIIIMIFIITIDFSSGKRMGMAE
jgi:hypothetical protein